MDEVLLVSSRILAWMSTSDASSHGSGATAIVELVGELDLTSVGKLERRLMSVVAESSYRATIIDLERLDFLSAGGVSMLLVAKRRAEEAGRDVQVMNAQGSPAKILRLLGLESWCKQTESVK